MADELGLLVTGGSDFHGDPSHGVSTGSSDAARPSRGSVCARRGIDMPAPERPRPAAPGHKDYRGLRPLRVEALDLHEGQTIALSASIR